MADVNNLFGTISNGTSEPPKKRGRPPKQRNEDNGDGNGNGVVEGGTIGSENGTIGSEAATGGESTTQDPISPESAIGGETGEPLKKRRGRKPGSTNKQKENAGRLAIGANQIQGLHVVLAKLTGQPIFEISEFEAQMLASSIANVSEHYDLTASSKTMAIVGLCGAIGIVYVPRVVAVRQANRKPKGPPPLFPEMPNPVPEQGPIKGRHNFDETGPH